MKKSIISNYFYSVFYQTLLVIIPLVITPYTTRVLGETLLSINVGTANILQWFALFGIMGINVYGNREIGRVRDDNDLLSKTFLEIVSMQILSFITMIILFLLYVTFIGDEYLNILIIQGFSLIATAIDITWFFYGVEDFKKITIRNCFVKILGVILIFTFVKSPDDFILFIIINISTMIIGQFVMWLQLSSYIKFCKISLKGVLRHFIPNIHYFIPQLAISVYSIMDVTMLRNLGKVAEDVFFYEVTQKFIRIFLFFVTSIGTVMLPRLSNIYAKGKVDQIQKYVNKTFKISIYLAIPMIFGICVVVKGFIGWFLPVQSQVVSDLIIIGSPLILLISLSNVFGAQYLLPVGNTKKYTTSVTIGAIVNFSINLIIIPMLGAFGAIISSLIGELAVTIYQWFVIRKSVSFYVSLRSIFNVIFSSVTMAIIVFMTYSFTTPSILVTLFQGIIGIICYVIMLYLLKDPLLTEVINLRKKS
ncbi:MAG: polysaccharide biosynthesis C-terminal domain-containing protein [Anaerorhabdus sp.]